tara:strand:+ start:4644 stop:5972 length:1329 start_codon:yes stop_codon:yes gene_type:complete
MYQKIVENIIYPISDKLMGLSINKNLKINRNVQWYTAKALNTLQKKKLLAMLSHCNNCIPYYKSLFKDYKFDIDGDLFQEIKKIPILTKKIIKQHLPSDLIDKTRSIYTTEKTSGSSGEQGEFYLDKEAFSKIIAAQTLYWEWAGYSFGKKAIQTGINPERGFKKRLKDEILLIKYSDAFKIDARIIRETLNPFRNKKDIFFIGYPSSIYSYAKFAGELNINDVSFKAIISLGDKMFSHYRSLIENKFNTEVFDTYGAAEGLMIAGECSEHKYHILSPHVLVEILDKDGKTVSDGELGEVVVTSLDNYLMPLIRYKIGDLAIKSKKISSCKCGRNLPIIDKIIGRDTDILFTPKLKILVVHFFTGIFEHFPEIEQFQVEQLKKGGRIQIKYIKGTNFSNNVLENIRNKIYQRAEENFPICFLNVKEIKPSPSGKPQIIVRAY